MKTMGNWLSGFLMLVALSFAGAPLAQTTTTVDVRNFEVIAVDGARLVFRDQKGTHEITVPDDFRFTVDGKKLSVKEMKAGHEGPGDRHVEDDGRSGDRDGDPPGDGGGYDAVTR